MKEYEEEMNHCPSTREAKTCKPLIIDTTRNSQSSLSLCQYLWWQDKCDTLATLNRGVGRRCANCLGRREKKKKHPTRFEAEHGANPLVRFKARSMPWPRASHAVCQ